MDNFLHDFFSRNLKSTTLYWSFLELTVPISFTKAIWCNFILEGCHFQQESKTTCLKPTISCKKRLWSQKGLKYSLNWQKHERTSLKPTIFCKKIFHSETGLSEFLYFYPNCISLSSVNCSVLFSFLCISVDDILFNSFPIACLFRIFSLMILLFSKELNTFT